MISSTLPLEILSYVVDSGSFGKRELCLISLASPYLRYEAQKKLFGDTGRHSINVNSDAGNSLLTAVTFLQAVISSPDRLARMVRRYHLTIIWSDFASPSKSNNLKERRHIQNGILNLLSGGLPLMINLAELEFPADVRCSTAFIQPSPPIFFILRQSTFHLMFFRCSYIDVGLGDRARMHKFLQNQCDVRALWIQMTHPPEANISIEILNSSSTFCPSAVSVGGDPAIITRMLLSGARLQHISWKGSWLKQDDTLLKRVKHVDSVRLMESVNDHGPGLHYICTTFSNLVLLKISSLNANRILKVRSSIKASSHLVWNML